MNAYNKRFGYSDKTRNASAVWADAASRSPEVPRSIGIDFDNTIVDYDDVFVSRARELGLVHGDFLGNKTQVRDAIRLLPDGNWKWTQLQAQVYGPDIGRAVPFPGFDVFLQRAARAGIPVYVISHKSRYAAADTNGFDLREAAFNWLQSQGLLTTGELLRRESIFFESERSEKIARIVSCGCSDFVDDLIDVFEHRRFPTNVRRYHFVGALGSAPGGYRSWQEITHAMFDR